MHPRAQPLTPILLAAGALAPLARAQDSVGPVPGSNAAISMFDDTRQRARYVVDLAEVSTSWNRRVWIAPILTATRDVTGIFNTNVITGGGVSAGFYPVGGTTGTTFPATDYALWTAPGQGVGPGQTAASTFTRTGYDLQFGLAIGDAGAISGASGESYPSGATGARIGFDVSPGTPAPRRRLYVERTQAASSAIIPEGPYSSTISLGAIDPLAAVSIRADAFGVPASVITAVKGENIARIDLLRRTTTGANAINFLLNLLSPTNSGWDGGATNFLVNAGSVTLATPAGFLDDAEISHTLAPSLAGTLQFDSSPPVTTHRAAAVTGLRGNPSYSITRTASPTGVGGTLGFLATTATGDANAISKGPVRTLNLVGLRSDGRVAGTPRAATMPANISNGRAPADPDAFSANAGGNSAEFQHWLSQTVFRGPSGQVGIGQTAGTTPRLLAAATATDATRGDFIAVATDPGAAGEAWTVAAFSGASPNPASPEGQQVLDASGGAPIGRLLANIKPGVPAPGTTPPLWASMSSPGIDLSGNVYFVSRWAPNAGALANTAQTGLFRASPTGAGGAYELELLVSTGRVIRGANSGTDYRITALRLTDTNSIASGAFHQGQVLQQRLPRANAPGVGSLFTVGGLAVNATIQYDRGGGITEEYEASLFLTPGKTLLADANDDGVADFADFNLVLSNYGASGPGLAGDLNGDGVVDFLDLNLILANYGLTE